MSRGGNERSREKKAEERPGQEGLSVKRRKGGREREENGRERKISGRIGRMDKREGEEDEG
jgi:hypothetical protein